jgi:hypothetical protein
MPEPVDGLRNAPGPRPQADEAQAEFAPPDNFRFQLLLAEDQHLTDTHLAPGVDHSLPEVFAFLPGEEQFNLAGQELSRRWIVPANPLRSQAASAADQPRREDLGVIENQEIAGPEYLRKLTKDAVLKNSRGPLHHQHARSVSFRERPLGD